MNYKARATRRAYRFEQVLRPLPRVLVRDTPMVRLRALAQRVRQGERPNKPLEVAAGRGVRRSGGGWTSFNCGSRIELARHHRCPMILLHEMAHWLGHNSHDWRFMKTYMYLLCRYAGLKRRWLNDAWRVTIGTHEYLE